MVEAVGGPADIPLERVRGDTKPFKIRLTDVDTGGYLDVAGYAAKWSINSDKNPTTTDDQVFTATGVPVNPTTDGIIEFAVAAFDITPGTYFYDVEVTDSAGKLDTIIKSKIKIIQDISK